MALPTREAERRLDALLEINQMMVNAVEPEEVILVTVQAAKRLFAAEACSLAVIDEVSGKLVFTVAAGGAEVRGFEIEMGQGIAGWVAQTGEGIICRDASKDSRFYPGVDQSTGFHTRSLLCAPLRQGGRITGAIEVLNMEDAEDLNDDDLRLLTVFGGLAGTAIDRARLFDTRLKSYVAIREQVQNRYELVVGTGRAMRAVVGLARTVAATDSTVLLLGESGTGKEILARAIHQWSARAERPFVAVNCVSLTPELMESDLFGHEKGAFTGAVSQKAGKFELAQGGTVFLDEIGDLPPHLQTRLLRVLQEREFQRVGGTKDIQADVRIIAATNRDIARAIRSGTFREDLYYRLNVVSITMPPLREHREDIPILAEHFMSRHCAEVKRAPLKIAPEAMERLRRFSRHGNVRELRNVIERAVVLCPGPVITEADLPADVCEAVLPEPEESSGHGMAAESFSFSVAVEQYKRHLIRRALDRCAGNQSEAARLLGLQRPNLSRLMKALALR